MGYGGFFIFPFGGKGWCLKWTATKVDEATRDGIELNGEPAVEAYARAMHLKGS